MDIRKQIEKYAPVSVKVDENLIGANQKEFISELVEAASCLNEIYLRQVYSENPKLREELKNAGKKSAELYEYFLINSGPYDRLENDEPFIEGIPPKALGATFYPNDLSKEEFESWLKKHPEDRKAFESNFTVIRRKGDRLVAVPYAEEYREWLVPAAKHLKRAAALADNESLKKYLVSRAEAFLSNDYFESDVDWVRLKNHSTEVVFGPYEVYEDKLFAYKAAFEAFVTIVDPVETKRLSEIVNFMGVFEQRLPIADEFKGIGRNLESPIVVAQEIYTAGDARRGVQTLAFNLPNDERVRQQEGSKKVMLKNVMHAKFDKILMPIASIAMSPKDVSNIKFEAFFAHVLLHEISHGIGPGAIRVNGRKTDVGRELKDFYAVIEECKADTLGVYNNLYLIEKGLYPKNFREAIWPTYLAGIMRSVRFGSEAAHGGGNAIQFNYVLEKGGFYYDKSAGLFGVNVDKIEGAMRDLAHALLLIEAKGDYKAAKEFAKKYRYLSPEFKKILSKLDKVPVDIRPMFEYE